MDLITAEDAAKAWGITRRRVQILCAKDRIEGAMKLGNVWVMPKETKKPADARLKTTYTKEQQWVK